MRFSSSLCDAGTEAVSRDTPSSFAVLISVMPNIDCLCVARCSRRTRPFEFAFSEFFNLRGFACVCTVGFGDAVAIVALCSVVGVRWSPAGCHCTFRVLLLYEDRKLH